MDATPVKRCTGCGQLKPATTEYFYSRGPRRPGQLVPKCKACTRRGRRPRPQDKGGLRQCTKCGEWKPATPEFYSANQRAHLRLRYQCKTCDAVCRKGYYSTNQAAILQKSRRDYWATPEVFRARSRDWALRHPDVARQRLHKYRASNRDKLLARAKEYAARYPERRRANEATRRARKAQAGGKYTENDIVRKLAAQDGRCWWCGEPLGGVYEVDHLVPLAKGGSNGPENIVIACKTCNRRKLAKLPHEFMGRLL